jgi:hypothetical protein
VHTAVTHVVSGSVGGVPPVKVNVHWIGGRVQEERFMRRIRRPLQACPVECCAHLPHVEEGVAGEVVRLAFAGTVIVQAVGGFIDRTTVQRAAVDFGQLPVTTICQPPPRIRLVEPRFAAEVHAQDLVRDSLAVTVLLDTSCGGYLALLCAAREEDVRAVTVPSKNVVPRAL